MKKKSNFLRNYNYQRTIEFYQGQDTSKNSWIIKFLIIITTLIICTLFFSIHFNINTDQSLEIRTTPGYKWTNQKVVAEYTFPIYKSYNDYIQEIKKAREKALQVFIENNSSIDKFHKQFNSIKSELVRYCNDSIKKEISFSEVINEVLEKIPMNQCKSSITKIIRILQNYMNDVYKNGYIDEALSTIENNEILILYPPNYSIIVKKNMLNDISTIESNFKEKFSRQLTNYEIDIALEIISNLNFPNLIFSKEETQKNMELAEKSVARYEGIVREGETIITKGEIVTESVIKKLVSYNKSKLLRSEINYTFLTFLGAFGHTAIIYLLIILYLFFIRKRIFTDNFQTGIISLFLILASFLSWLSITIPSDIPIEFLIFLPGLSMLAAIIFDSRTAFYITVTMSLLIAGIRGNDYITGLIYIFTGAIAAYTVRDIQNRTQIFQSILFIFIGFLISIVSINLERASDFSTIANQSFLAAINSIVSPLITFGMLFLFERYTNITTDLKLQEYDNLNHPLLLKLSEQAPGTYQHTQIIANLAERCATVIGANPLLAKVGSLYHDIGKLSRPEYFIENQLDIDNKHKDISPLQSAQAIKEHVTDGIKIAHEYNLPQRIIDFIPTHHGTTLIKHFYALALEQAEDKSKVNENDFRYPGPKPFSKETAIVMICDFSEALSRVVGHNKDELLKAINDNIMERLHDGQFNECDITLNDLNKIEETLVKLLIASSHQRVVYKEIPDND